MRKTTFAAALVLAATAACSDAASGPAQPLAPVASDSLRADRWRVDLRAARASLLEAERAQSEATQAVGFVDGYTAPLADDARFLTAGPGVIRGRAAIRAYIASTRLSTSRMRWDTFRADVSADGTTGYTFGGGVYTRVDGTTAYSRNAAFWRRGADGAWKVEAMVLNLTNVAAAPAPEGFGTPQDNGVRGAHPTDPAVSAAEAMQADRDFAAMSEAQSPGAAFLAFAAPDAVVIGGPSYGRDEIGQGFPSDSKARLVWGPIDGGASGSGDLAFTIGHATQITPLENGGEARSYTKYLTIWRKQPNGDWRYVVDGGNSRPAS